MKISSITPQQFIAWRKKLGLSQSAVARKLGISASSVWVYESGKRKEGNVKIPLLVALGMSAISSGLTPYEGEKVNVNSDQSSTQSSDPSGAGRVL